MYLSPLSQNQNTIFLYSQLQNHSSQSKVNYTTVAKGMAARRDPGYSLSLLKGRVLPLLPSPSNSGTSMLLSSKVSPCLSVGKGEVEFMSGAICCEGDSNCPDFGKRKIKWPNGDSYEGDVVNDLRNGKGIYKMQNGWIKDVLDYAFQQPITTAASAIAGIAGSVFGGYLSRTAYSGINVIAAHTAVVVVGSGLAKNAVANGLQTVENYVYENPIPSVFAMSGIIGSVFFGYVACATKPPRTAIPQISILKPNAIAVLSFSSGLLACLSTGFTLSNFQRIAALAPKISSEINGLTQSFLDDAYDNPRTTAASVISGMIVGSVFYAKSVNTGRDGPPLSFQAIRAVAAAYARNIRNSLCLGLIAAKGTQAIIKAGQQSKQANGWIKDITDYVYDNPKTSVASAIAGIAGSVLGPLYSKAAILRAGAMAFNAVMIPAIMDAARYGPVRPWETQNALAASNNAHSATVLRQILVRSLVSGLGTAIVPHVVNYVVKQFMTVELPKTESQS